MRRDRARARASECTRVLTDMDAPIGRTIGNALEIRESIEVLRGGGSRRHARADAVARRRDAACSAASAEDPADGAARADRGGARRRPRARGVPQVVEAQGGDPRVCDSPGSVLPSRRTATELARAAGAIVAIDAEALGHRGDRARRRAARKEDAIDPSAGLVRRRVPRRGDRAGRARPSRDAAPQLRGRTMRRVAEARRDDRGRLRDRPADRRRAAAVRSLRSSR